MTVCQFGVYKYDVVDELDVEEEEVEEEDDADDDVDDNAVVVCFTNDSDEEDEADANEDCGGVGDGCVGDESVNIDEHNGGGGVVSDDDEDVGCMKKREREKENIVFELIISKDNV